MFIVYRATKVTGLINHVRSQIISQLEVGSIYIYLTHFKSAI